MAVEQIDQNSVVVANQVNPTIFTPAWLGRQDLVPLDTIEPGAIVAPQVVQIQTADFHLMVLPDRIQLTPKCEHGRQGEVVRRIMGGIVERLPETPYFAAGINFTYHVRPAVHFAQRDRELFGRENAVARFFADENARFGSYYSQDYLDCRLKLEIKPAHHVENRADEFFAFSFNFHRPIHRETAVQEIQELLARWDEARQVALNIAASAE